MHHQGMVTPFFNFRNTSFIRVGVGWRELGREGGAEESALGLLLFWPIFKL